MKNFTNQFYRVLEKRSTRVSPTKLELSRANLLVYLIKLSMYKCFFSYIFFFVIPSLLCFEHYILLLFIYIYSFFSSVHIPIETLTKCNTFFFARLRLLSLNNILLKHFLFHLSKPSLSHFYSISSIFLIHLHNIFAFLYIRTFVFLFKLSRYL